MSLKYLNFRASRFVSTQAEESCTVQKPRLPNRTLLSLPSYPSLMMRTVCSNESIRSVMNWKLCWMLGGPASLVTDGFANGSYGRGDLGGDTNGVKHRASISISSKQLVMLLTVLWYTTLSLHSVSCQSLLGTRSNGWLEQIDRPASTISKHSWRCLTPFWRWHLQQGLPVVFYFARESSCTMDCGLNKQSIPNLY